MRLRVRVLACALTMLASLTAAGPVSAAPHHNRGLTIAATPNPVIAGQAVLIYGRLSGSDDEGQLIRLYHHVVGSDRGYTPVATTHTDSAGYYEFVRPDGLIYTNRSWFVQGPDGSHSRTFYERVIPLVSIDASRTSTDTNHPIVFSGHVVPNHRFEQVFLQEQIGSSDDWRTLRETTLDPASNYYVAYRWSRPGVHDVRVLFPGDDRNTRGTSDPVTVDIEQAQVPGFTIKSSDPIIPSGGSVTISGVLDQPGTAKGESGQIVQLWGRTPDQRHFTVLADTTTGSDGSYSFTQSGLTTNTVYYVATMPIPGSPHRHTARLYEGVRDVVTMQATSSSNGTVTFTGTVKPDKTGHVIYLQKLGADNEWHRVEAAIVQPGSTFTFSWAPESAGTYTFRARITSDERNIGSASPPVTVNATTPSAASLPPAS